MTIRVLVVDDSRFFRRRIADILEADAGIKVIDFAENGAEAVRKVEELKPDVVTMDVEMPVMDGITAVKHIMQRCPTPILMFSSLTTDGAKATLDALDAGALDFIPKRFEDISQDREEAKVLLRMRVREIASKGYLQRPRPLRPPASKAAQSSPPPKPATALPRPSIKEASAAKIAPHPAPAPAARQRTDLQNLKLIAIGTSTGGPVALQAVLSALPASFPLPIILVQHMPGTFTTAFAQRLNQICAITVKEAADGDVLQPGHAYLAPGGKQMLLQQRAGRLLLKIEAGDPGLNYKPSVDLTFASVATAAPGQALGIILTGMGADGREGARQMKKTGARIWAQDEESSVVYGMPFAVAEAGLTDKILALAEIGPALANGA
ncbi:MAG: chemotaxis response regulator protein-glutamate methylesterase [Pseudomonadota bacterium]